MAVCYSRLNEVIMKDLFKKIFSYKVFKKRYYWWKILFILLFEITLFCFYYFLGSEDVINEVASKISTIGGYDVKQMIIFSIYSSMFFIAFVWFPFTLWRLLLAWTINDAKKENQ